MKTIFTIALLIMQCNISFAQDDSTEADGNISFKQGVRSQFGQDKKRSDIYGSFFLTVDAKAGTPGGGMILGFTPAKYFGFGGTFEGIKAKGLNGGNKIGVNTLVEFRLFAPAINFLPSIAVQYGVFNYSDQFNASSGSIISQIEIKGKSATGINVNFCLSKKHTGLSFGYSYRSIEFESSSNITQTRAAGGAIVTTHSKSTSTSKSSYHLTTLGFNF